MKSCVLISSALLVMSGVWAQQSGSESTAERQRIAEQRQAAQTRYEQAFQRCKGLFAQTDCEKKAGKQRRTELQAVRAQEKQLNDQERQRKAAQQQMRVTERAKEAAAREQKQPHNTTRKVDKPAIDADAAIQAQLRSEERRQAKLRQVQLHREKSEQSQKNKPQKSAPLPVPQ